MIKTLATVVGLTLTTMLGAKGNDSVIAEGKFKPTDESLKTYECPEWFRDAKFGIWSHWGPQAVPRQGDWYARNMYRMCIIKTKNVTQVKLTVSICIILNTTDILRNLDTKTSFLCGRPKDGILRN